MYRERLGSLNVQIASLKKAEAERHRLERRVVAIEQEGRALEEKVRSLGKTLASEQRDVDSLERGTVTAMFYSMLGKKEARLDKERQELLAATLKHEDAVAELERLSLEQVQSKRRLAELSNVSAELATLMKHKETWLHEHGGSAAEALFSLAEEAGRLESLAKELHEALTEGYAARDALRDAIRSLVSAQSWGTLDILGGAGLTTAAKHDRIDDARADVFRARQHVADFQRELKDVQLQCPTISIQIDEDLSSFADFFLDGVIFDLAVQSKINRSLDSLRRALAPLEGTLDQLLAASQTIEQQRQDIERKRTDLIERC